MVLAIAVLAVLLVVMAVVMANVCAENHYLECRCKSLERQVDWLTSSYDLEASGDQSTTQPGCIRCGRPDCPHPTLTDAEAHV